MIKGFLLNACLLIGLTGSVFAQTLRPTITLVTPPGGQRGTTVSFSIEGVNIGYGTQVIVDAPGVTIASATSEAPPANARNPGGKLVVKAKVAPDAPLGRFPLRVVTAFGPSTVGYLVIGEWPEIMEPEPNNRRDLSPVIKGPVTINGKCDGAEDTDTFKIAIAKGETIVFSAAAGSIGSALTPVLTLRDARGHECGFSATLARSDALLTFTARESGDYFVEIRDLTYQGSANHFYRLTVGNLPGVTGVFPLGGVAGTTVRLKLAGYNLPEPADREFPVPKERPLAPLVLPDSGNRKFAVGFYPEVIESERNDTPVMAQPVTLPVTVNGRIYVPYSSDADTDCFRFRASKGQALVLEVQAARLGSPLDSVLSVLDATGKELASNDDAKGRDSQLTFSPPADGDYIARVTDVAGRSGEGYAYRLTIAPPAPDVQVSVSPDCLAVGPGDFVPVTVTVDRQNGFNEDIALSFTGLPPGLQIQGTPRIPPGQNTVTLFASADTKATAAASRLQVTASATTGGRPFVRNAQSLEVNYFKDNDQVVKPTTQPVPLPLAAVTGPPDLILSVPPEPISLGQGKTVTMKVTITRRADFTAKVPIVVQGLPTGVSVSGNEIPEKLNEATITLKAEANATPGEFSLVFLGRSVVDELHFSDHAVLPIRLTVVK